MNLFSRSTCIVLGLMLAALALIYVALNGHDLGNRASQKAIANWPASFTPSPR